MDEPACNEGDSEVDAIASACADLRYNAAAIAYADMKNHSQISYWQHMIRNLLREHESDATVKAIVARNQWK